MLTGTFTIQDMKLVSLAYKTLCDLWVHVSKLENVLAQDFKDCIISTRKMVTCPKLHKFCRHQATAQTSNGSNGVPYFNTRSTTSVAQHFMSLRANIRR